MKKQTSRLLAALVAAFLLVSIPLRADPVKVKLKFDDILALSGSLSVLDGIPHEVKTSDQGSKIIRVPLDLKPGARIAAAKNIAAIKLALEGFEAQRVKLLNDVSPGAPERVAKDDAMNARFTVLWNAYVKEAVALDLESMTEEQLNLDANREITGSVLAALAPLLSPPKK